MRPDRQAQIERLRAVLAAQPHVRALKAFLATPGGHALMAALEREFVFGELAGETQLETERNLGAREVVLYLRQLRDLTERTGTDEAARQG